MGLFKKNDAQEPRPPQNPGTFLFIRLLAIVYLLWMTKDMIQMYIAGGADAPSLGLLIGAIVLFVGGSAWIAWSTWKQYTYLKAEQAAAAEAEAMLEAEEAEDAPEKDPEEEPEEE